MQSEKFKTYTEDEELSSKQRHKVTASSQHIDTSNKANSVMHDYESQHIDTSNKANSVMHDYESAYLTCHGVDN